jgi:enoyl-CoA hydratase
MGVVSKAIVEGVAVVTISAPEVRNALTFEMTRELVRALDEVDADPSIGALIIRGDGKNFCSGADTRDWEWRADSDVVSEEGYRRTSQIYDAFTRISRAATPTIAAVRGAAVGAGLNIALACDLRVVADDARFISGFIRAGVLPGGGFFTLAQRTGGRETAAALGVFGQEMSGAAAARAGLAWSAVPDADVDAVALRIARDTAADPALAREAVRTFRLEAGPPALPLDVAVEVERGSQMWSRKRRQDALPQGRTP